MDDSSYSHMSPQLEAEIGSPGFVSRIAAFMSSTTGAASASPKLRSSEMLMRQGRGSDGAYKSSGSPSVKPLVQPKYKGLGLLPRVQLNKSPRPRLRRPNQSPSSFRVKIAPPQRANQAMQDNRPEQQRTQSPLAEKVASPNRLVAVLQEISARKRDRTQLKLTEQHVGGGISAGIGEGDEEETGSKRARRDSSSSVGSSLSMEMPPLFSNGVIGQTTSQLVSREADLSLNSLLSRSSQSIFKPASASSTAANCGTSVGKMEKVQAPRKSNKLASNNEIASSLSSSVNIKRARESDSDDAQDSDGSDADDSAPAPKHRRVYSLREERTKETPNRMTATEDKENHSLRLPRIKDFANVMSKPSPPHKKSPVEVVAEPKKAYVSSVEDVEEQRKHGARRAAKLLELLEEEDNNKQPEETDSAIESKGETRTLLDDKSKTEEVASSIVVREAKEPIGKVDKDEKTTEESNHENTAAKPHVADTLTSIDTGEKKASSVSLMLQKQGESVPGDAGKKSKDREDDQTTSSKLSVGPSTVTSPTAIVSFGTKFKASSFTTSTTTTTATTTTATTTSTTIASPLAGFPPYPQLPVPSTQPPEGGQGSSPVSKSQSVLPNFVPSPSTTTFAFGIVKPLSTTTTTVATASNETAKSGTVGAASISFGTNSVTSVTSTVASTGFAFKPSFSFGTKSDNLNKSNSAQASEPAMAAQDAKSAEDKNKTPAGFSFKPSLPSSVTTCEAPKFTFGSTSTPDAKKNLSSSFAATPSTTTNMTFGASQQDTTHKSATGIGKTGGFSFGSPMVSPSSFAFGTTSASLASNTPPTFGNNVLEKRIASTTTTTALPTTTSTVPFGGTTSLPTPATNVFKFGATSLTTTSQTAATTSSSSSSSPFVFGASKSVSDEKQSETKPAPPGFQFQQGASGASFGTASKTFSFPAPSTSGGFQFGSGGGTSTSSGFSFSTLTTTTATSTSANAVATTATSSLPVPTFGSPFATGTTSATTTTSSSSFTFGAAKSEEPKASGLFKFGATASQAGTTTAQSSLSLTTTPSFSFGQAGSQPSSTSNFSFGDKKPSLGFSFAPAASQAGETAKPASSSVFAFGASATGAAAPVFGDAKNVFGGSQPAGSGSKTNVSGSTGIFQFGTAGNATNNSSTTPSASFTFGSSAPGGNTNPFMTPQQPSSGTSGSFTFKAGSKDAPDSTTSSQGFNFGASAKTQSGVFAFGGGATNPAPTTSFGASGPQAGPTAVFQFGVAPDKSAPSSGPAPPFQFGQPSSSGTPFGGSAGFPTSPAGPTPNLGFGVGPTATPPPGFGMQNPNTMFSIGSNPTTKGRQIARARRTKR